MTPSDGRKTQGKGDWAAGLQATWPVCKAGIETGAYRRWTVPGRRA
ncbi:hypothetical protein M8494_20165 [Serratia ureilytica]